MKTKLLAIATLAWSAAVWAWPDKPVTIVVPFAAGGPADKIGRDLADALRKPLGANVIVENLGGAGGSLGSAKVAKAAPDGYTLLLHNVGLATAPALYSNLGFKPLEDFEYLGLVNEVPMTLVARPTMPANNMAELHKWLSANAAKVTMAHAGIGSAAHLCALLFQHSVKLDFISVPYKGTGPAMVDVLGGQVDLMCDQTLNTSSLIATGRVKGYAVTTPQRLATPALARLPTLEESGLKGFSVTSWYGMYAPRGTPRPVLEKVQAALRSAMRDPQFIKHQEDAGTVVVTDARVNPAEHRRFVEAEMAKWGPVIRAAGQYAD